MPRSTRAALISIALLAAAPAAAEDVVITQFGAAFAGNPFGVAIDGGYFKQAGVDITGVISGSGGGTSVRNVIASSLGYGEVVVSAAVAAIQEGQDIRIVNIGARSVADNMERAGQFDSDLGDDARVALYAKGRVLGKYLLTLAYDSAKQREDQRVLGAIDPQAYYTVFGDASARQFDAASREKLYVRIETATFYALYGDFQTAFNQTRLANYNRTVTGVKGEARVDASGNFEYINWVGPQQPGEYTYDESGDYAETADPFEIRVTDAHGASASPRALWLRYVVGGLSLMLGGLGFWWAWIDRERLTWHDRISKTRMIREPR